MQKTVLGAAIKSAMLEENKIIIDAKIVPIIKKTIIATSNILFASLNRPRALLLETIIDKATGNPDVEITYKNAYISYNLIVVCEDYHAGMAELADAHGSGPCESNFMQVQLLLPAPNSINPNPKPMGEGFGFFRLVICCVNLTLPALYLNTD